MSLTISLTNNSSENQSITLFDSGGANSLSFARGSASYLNSTLTDVSSIVDSSTLTTLVLSTINFYENASLLFTASIPIGSSIDTIIYLVNQSAEINYPDLQFCALLQTIGNVAYFTPSILDNGQTNWTNITWIDSQGGGGGIGCVFMDSVNTNVGYTAINLNPNPQVLANNNDPIIISTNNWQSRFSFARIREGFSSSLSYIPGNYYYVEITLPETIPTNIKLTFGTIQISNDPNRYDALALGNTTSTQSFILQFGATTSYGLQIALQSTVGIANAMNGNILVRIGNLNCASGTSYSINLTQGQGKTLCTTNPNIVANTGVTGVGLLEILNSTIGNSYKVTSLYIFSPNPKQLIQGITYGIIDSNGNIAETSLDIVVDPYAQNQFTYRTNNMDNFIIDSNAIIQFTLLGNSSVNMKFEYDKIGFDEMKLIDMGLGKLLGIEQAEKERLDMDLGTPGADSDFTQFYATQ